MKRFIYFIFLILFALTSCEKEDGQDTNGHDFVDLGLPSGTLWATMNVGADSPEDYGDYFAWGETKSKKEYSIETYKWCWGTYDTYTKYCSDSEYGDVDNRIVLELSDDAANVNWGGDCRMPTKSELAELFNNCTLNVGNRKGVNGLTLTGPNGKSIFLPAAGVSYEKSIGAAAGYSFYYWTSSYARTAYAHIWYAGTDGYELSFGDYFENDWTGGMDRCIGASVRPVLR